MRVYRLDFPLPMIILSSIAPHLCIVHPFIIHLTEIVATAANFNFVISFIFLGLFDRDFLLSLSQPIKPIWTIKCCIFIGSAGYDVCMRARPLVVCVRARVLSLEYILL